MKIFVIPRYFVRPGGRLNVNSLPDDCLLAIFDRVSLLNLLQLDRVCHRWATLLPSACARRRTLVLILGGKRVDEIQMQIPFNNIFEMTRDGQRRYFDLPLAERDASLTLTSLMPSHKSFAQFLLDNDDESNCGFFDILYYSTIGGPTEVYSTELACLHQAQLSGQLVSYLIGLLPNVKKLVVIHSRCYENELHSMINLLFGPWRLATLKLWILTENIDYRYFVHHERHPVLTLLHTIHNQSSSSLQHLTLAISGQEWVRFAFPVESYSFILRLKTVQLFLGWYDANNSIWEIVNRFDSPQLRQIGIGNKNHSLLEDVPNPEFTQLTKVTQLYSKWRFEAVEQIGGFCRLFPALTMLRMEWTPDITFAQLVFHLAVLTQLTHLKLSINFELHPENAFAMVVRVEGAPISLPQIKFLELFITMRSHLDFESLSPHVFPSLKSIDLQVFSTRDCAICGPGSRNSAKCLRLMQRSLNNKTRNSALDRGIDLLERIVESDIFNAIGLIAAFIVILRNLGFSF